jgi:citrate lyase subunit beta/citryl-CoA lyase
VACARTLLAPWKGAQAQGLGAIQVDGRMVDKPVVERARRFIEQAAANGSL